MPVTRHRPREPHERRAPARARRILAIPDVREKLGSPEIREMVDAFMLSVPPQTEAMEASGTAV